MATIPKKTVGRLVSTVGKFQKILKGLEGKDLSEADTVKIVTDILAEVFGFDKYTEIRSQDEIKGGYCDLIIDINNKPQFIIEVKRLDLELKTNYIRQAVGYGSNKGVKWVALTNGIKWEIYRIRFETRENRIVHNIVNSFNFLELNPKKTDDQEKLFILCKKGISSDAREELFEYVQCANRFVIGALLLTENITSAIKREIRKISPGLKIDNSEIEKILEKEVIKRDIMEGDEALNAKRRVKRMCGKAATKPKVAKPVATAPSPTFTSPPQEKSITVQP